MDFIRTSWNNNIPPTEFQRLFLERNDKLLIISKLFDLIGHFSGKEKFDFDDFFFHDSSTTQLFILYEYLFYSLCNSPQFFISTILEHSQAKSTSQNFIRQDLNKLGLVRFISYFGDRLFDSYSNPEFIIDARKFSFCYLFVLQTCLSFGFDSYSLTYSDFTINDQNYLNSYEFYISEISISKLSSSLSFNVMIAHSRIYYKNEIIYTRKMFMKRIILTARKFFYSFQSTEPDYDEKSFLEKDLLTGEELHIDVHDKSEMFLTLNGLHSWSILKFIVLSDRPYIESKISLIPRCEVMLYVIADLRIIQNNPCAFEFASNESLYDIYLSVGSIFFTTPSLYLAFMITTYFVQYISYAEAHNLQMANDPEILNIYSDSKVHNLFNHMRNASQAGFLSHHGYTSEEIKNDSIDLDSTQNLSHFKFNHDIEPNSFKFISSFDDIEAFLTRIPNHNDYRPNVIEHFYETLFKYPSDSSFVISNFLNTLEQDRIEVCAKISLQILRDFERLQDFRMYIYKRGHFFLFMTQLLRVASITTDEELFYPILLLVLTLMRFTWGGGTPGIYDRFIIFVDTIEPLPIRFLIRYLLQIDPEKENLSRLDESNFYIDHPNQNPTNPKDFLGFSRFYPFYIASRTLNDLIEGKIHLVDVFQFVSDHPYLWIPVLLYAYSFPTDENKEIIQKEKQPDEELIKLLFKQVMLRMMGKGSKKWFAASEMFDLMIMKENPPDSPNDISVILSNHFKLFIIPKELRYSKIIGVSNIWHALSDHFGFEVFVNVFLREIIRTMSSVENYACFETYDIKSLSYHDSPLIKFTNSVAHIFGVFLNYGLDRLKISINQMINIVENESEFLSNSSIIYSFAQFAIIIINDAKDNWKESFFLLIDKCKSILKSYCNQSKSKRAKISLYFIQTALIIPKFRDLLINDNLIYKSLMDINDGASIIDFLIAKDISTNRKQV